MNVKNSNHAIEYLNTLGAQKTPCVFIIDYAMQNIQIWKTTEIPNNIKIAFPNFSYQATGETQKTSVEIVPKQHSKTDFDSAFQTIQKHIKHGNSFLINLTASTEIETKHSLSDIFSAAHAPFKLLYNSDFVVFSPEPFVTISGDTICTFPMKGTIDASIPNAENIILSNKKEQAEHATIVDLLRNDMSIIAEHVYVKKYRYLEKITSNSHSLLQVSSCIEGSIMPHLKNQIGTILFSMLPAGSISGAPKPKTIEIIKRAEYHTRGYYTGIMGYFDGAFLESAVMIRFIEQKNGKLYFKSGGGITSQSNIDEEYQEIIQKIYVPTH